MNSVLRINLLPWRAARQQKLQKQWLLAAGLITVRDQGNQKHYQANAASPVFAELRGLVE